MRMALEERGMTILGRPVKYITRGRRDVGRHPTRRVEEAVDATARFVVGPWSWGVALAVSEVAKRKVVHPSAGAPRTSRARRHRYSFQWAASPYTAAKTVVTFYEGQPEGQALAPAGGRLRLRLVGREVHRRSARRTA
jgi:ABC-type branched-subunit amino acid transport system substrate-binding protein